MPQTPTTDAPDFAAMLATVTTEPGTLSAAYTRFHAYSLGNMLLAYGQLTTRGIPLGPIASFHAWKDLGRFVKKGEKAIQLCMPITCKRRQETPDDEPETFTRFVYKRHWFALAQTDGQPYEAPAPPTWDKARALAALGITEEPFEHLDGNCQGYARARTIAISPIAAHPWKTTLHELAHVVIGHTTEAELRDDERTPRDIRELEAEATAMLCCAALGLPGIDESRAYIQHWYGAGQPVPESSARKIFKAADAILRAGQEAPTHGENVVDDPRERNLDR
jgi:antirestriction protein ArdC